MVNEDIKNLGYNTVELDFTVGHLTELYLTKYRALPGEGLAIRRKFRQIGFHFKTIAAEGIPSAKFIGTTPKFKCFGKLNRNEFVSVSYRQDYKSLTDKVSMIIRELSGPEHNFLIAEDSSVAPATLVYPEDSDRTAIRLWVPARASRLIQLIKTLFESRQWYVETVDKATFKDTNDNLYISLQCWPGWDGIYEALYKKLNVIEKDLFK